MSEQFRSGGDNRRNKGEIKRLNTFALLSNINLPSVLRSRFNTISLKLAGLRHSLPKISECGGGSRQTDSLTTLQTGQLVFKSSLLLRVAIYEYSDLNKPIELSYALLTAKHKVTIVLQTLVNTFSIPHLALPHTLRCVYTNPNDGSRCSPCKSMWNRNLTPDLCAFIIHYLLL